MPRIESRMQGVKTVLASLLLASLPVLSHAGQSDADASADTPTKVAACPDAMALVEGEYCKRVHQQCREWMEKPPPNHDGRCARFAPTECVGDRVTMRFCIDRDEYTAPGDTLPTNMASWTDARGVCESIGKRLCRETEWNFACEGEQMLPYPTGLVREHILCNVDRLNLYDARGRPLDLRMKAAEVAGCVSPFGVRSLVGNVDEWVERDVTPGPWRSALKGGWWLAARNRCRPATTAHDEHYRDFQTGFRCCSDARTP